MEIYESEKTFTKSTLPDRGSYEQCIFRDCQWQQCDLSRYVFTDCEFHQCDLSMVKVNGTTFNGVVFRSCRLTGIRFEHTDPHLFDVAFEECSMHLISFYGKKMDGSRFNACQLREADFTSADLKDASFDHCDLGEALFQDSILHNTDFRQAMNVGLQLSENQVKGARFRMDQLPPLIRTFRLQLDT